MKKTLLIFTIISMAFLSEAQSDSTKTENMFSYRLRLSYVRSSLQESYLFLQEFLDLLDDVQRRMKSSSGAIFLNNWFVIDKKTEIGVSVGFERVSARLIDRNSKNNVGNLDYSFIVTGFDVFTTYGKKKNLDSKVYLYGATSVAYVRGFEELNGSPFDEEDSSFREHRVGIQFTPIGLGINTGKLRIRTDFGYGRRGTITFSMDYKLSK